MSHILHYRSGQTLCSPSCPIEHIDIPLNKIKEPPNFWPDTRGLNSLNYSRDNWLNGDAIETSIAEYCRGLPQALQDKIGLGVPGLKPDFWAKGPKGSEAVEMAIKVPMKRALANLKRTEYSIFPICSNDMHWVLVFMHKALREGTTEWLHVEDLVVIDPERKNTTMNRVSSRLREWLLRAGDFSFSPSSTKIVWIPAQRDSTSCGPRAYWNAKQMIDRLLELEEGVISPDDLYRDLSGWFNEEFVRAEMTGRCAWAAVRAMDYKARISVECVNQVRDYSGGRPGPWQSANSMMRPVNIKNMKPEKRPHVHTGFPDNDADYGMGLENVAPPEEQPAEDNNVAMLDSPPPMPVPPRDWTPPVPMPNQHKLVPDLNVGSKDAVIVDDSDDDELQPTSKGPAFSPIPPASTPLIVLDDSNDEPPAMSQDIRASKSSEPLNLFSSIDKTPRPVTRDGNPKSGTAQTAYGLNTPISSKVDPSTGNPNSSSITGLTTPLKRQPNNLTPSPSAPRKPASQIPELTLAPKILFPRRESKSPTPNLPVTFPSPKRKASSTLPAADTDSSPARDTTRPSPKRRAIMQLGLGPSNWKATPSPAPYTGESISLTPTAKGSRKHARADDDDEVAYVLGPASRKLKSKKNAKGYKAVSWLFQ
ncbi:hypothetical protein F5B22DRAFT_546275 [Xylaria bambusicola]|uniref:uncharacterized protein n=1 Tax=Xylaria bambusicola TaxID=326684 RepID=UPI0020079753|nr:uncharacterized protein F5B22DRAFT_546275 [Xylaria bambusicola]KAI0521667.1 hypothetical protein F5B22DRAFT_546275 [Xylaria bambusicola]